MTTIPRTMKKKFLDVNDLHGILLDVAPHVPVYVQGLGPIWKISSARYFSHGVYGQPSFVLYVEKDDVETF